MKKFQLGFTLIELLVVITIIAVLAGVGMVSFSAAGRSARDARRQADIQTIRQALVMYRSEFGCYPDGNIGSALAILQTEGYISAPLPIDPRPPSAYTYTSSGDTAICKDATTGRKGFVLRAVLENSPSPYEVRNP